VRSSRLLHINIKQKQFIIAVILSAVEKYSRNNAKQTQLIIRCFLFTEAKYVK